MELPPRTRRIRRVMMKPTANDGTTSAYAENTCCTNLMWTNMRNYLRVRGEYSAAGAQSCAPRELPPRTRRIQASDLYRIHLRGTTSAYAENTVVEERLESFDGNYLRVRGEYRFHAPFG